MKEIDFSDARCFSVEARSNPLQGIASLSLLHDGLLAPPPDRYLSFTYSQAARGTHSSCL